MGLQNGYSILNQKQYDSETQSVAITAKELQKDNPDLSWGECIRLAEKWMSESKNRNWS